MISLNEREYEILLEALHRFEEDNRRPFASDVRLLANKIGNWRDETRRVASASHEVEVKSASRPPTPAGEQHD